MARRPRRNHSAAFKAKVAMTAIPGDRTLAELAQEHDLHPNQIADGKNELLERAAECFEEDQRAESMVDLKAQHAKNGQLALANSAGERTYVATSCAALGSSMLLARSRSG